MTLKDLQILVKQSANTGMKQEDLYRDSLLPQKYSVIFNVCETASEILAFLEKFCDFV